MVLQAGNSWYKHQREKECPRIHTSWINNGLMQVSQARPFLFCSTNCFQYVVHNLGCCVLRPYTPPAKKQSGTPSQIWGLYRKLLSSTRPSSSQEGSFVPTGLGGLTVQACSLSGYSHCPPPQPLCGVYHNTSLIPRLSPLQAWVDWLYKHVPWVDTLTVHHHNPSRVSTTISHSWAPYCPIVLHKPSTFNFKCKTQ